MCTVHNGMQGEYHQPTPASSHDPSAFLSCPTTTFSLRAEARVGVFIACHLAAEPRPNIAKHLERNTTANRLPWVFTSQRYFQKTRSRNNIPPFAGFSLPFGQQIIIRTGENSARDFVHIVPLARITEVLPQK